MQTTPVRDGRVKAATSTFGVEKRAQKSPRNARSVGELAPAKADVKKGRRKNAGL
jgi:hypothetical protein